MAPPGNVIGGSSPLQAANHKPRHPGKSASRAAAWIVLAVALAATGSGWGFLRHKAEESIRARFDIRVEVIRQWLVERIHGYGVAVHAGAGLVVSSDEVTSEEWDEFVRSLQIRTSYPGLTQLALIERPEAAAPPLSAFDTVDGSPNTEPASLVVEFAAPGPLRFPDRDLSRIPEYQHAASAARDSGRVTVSECRLRHGDGLAYLPALFLPLYAYAEQPASVDDRRRLLRGWLVAWFQPEVLVGALPSALARQLDVEIFAAEDPSDVDRVYDSDPSHRAGDEGSGALSARMPLEIGGRTWSLVVEATPQFAASERSGATMVFVAGLIVSLILFVVTDTLASSRMRALAAAKLMTERLRHNEAYSRAIVENAPVGILTFAPDGVLETVNSAAEKIFGYLRHELVGCTFEELIEEPAGLRAKGYEGFFEFGSGSGRRADATVFPLELSIWPTQAGERRGYTAIVVDVTERQQAAQALRAERDFSAAVLNLAPALVVVMDLEGRIVAFNRACEQTTGYSFLEVEGKRLPELLVAPEERSSAERIVGQVRAGVHPIHQENFWVTKQGRRRLISWANASLLDDTGAPKYVIACGEDVTEQREAERASQRYVVELEHAQQTTRRQADMLARQAAELATARDAALESAQLKTQFLTNMSHEIRTPMSGVLGMTHLILGTNLNEEQQDYATTIRASAEALLVIINDILDFSKIEAGKLHFDTVDFNLAETVHGAVQLLAQQATGKGIELKSKIAPDVPRLVRGDSGRLRQVLLNLLGNAIKFTNHGSVEVELALKDQTRDSVELAFCIRDTGIGIAPETQKRLFHPFVQADGSTSRRHGGTGLGLAICKYLVEHMGGEISCESHLGKGSEFKFTVKLGIRKSESEAPPLDGRSKGALPPALGGNANALRAGKVGSRPGCLRVLVAEDNAVNQKVAVRMLQKLGCEAEVVVNGREAVAALERTSYDLILMDCQMPEMDGYQATAEIRRRETEQTHVPIIALTAHAVQGARERCLEAGMDDYLSKPIEPQALVTALRRWGSATIDFEPRKAGSSDRAR